VFTLAKLWRAESRCKPLVPDPYICRIFRRLVRRFCVGKGWSFGITHGPQTKAVSESYRLNA
jgi:hypothetical protein